jgi:lipase chaperone LimK
MHNRTKPSWKILSHNRRSLGLITAILVSLGLVLYPFSSPEPEAQAPELTTQLKPAAMPLMQSEQVDVTGPSDQMSYQPLILELTLRWKFDDLILAYQQQQLPLEAQLIQLSKSLVLNVSDQSYLLALFARYRDYQLALVEFKKHSPNIGENIQIEQSLVFIEQVHDMQYDYFSDTEIAAFFDQDNAYDQQALARVSIRQDSSLSAAQKQQLLEHQISQLTELERQALMPSLQVQQIVQQIAEQVNGQSLQPLDMSPEVTARVQALTQAEQQWQQRVREYQAFQTSNANIDAADLNHLDEKARLEKMQAYRQQHFSPQELKRLQVFLANPSLLDAS